MSQLEAKVDSAVASHGAQALRDAANGGEEAGAAQAGGRSTGAASSAAASVRSGYVGEIDLHGHGHAQQLPGTAGSRGS